MNDALLLIDLQNDYFDGGAMTLQGAELAAVQAARALKWFRQAGKPVVHVQHLSVRPGATFFLPGTTGADLHLLVGPEADEPVVQKHFPNAFRDTVLLECLQQRSVTGLVIAGAMTHMCVDATVRAAFDLGFKVTVLADACATRSLLYGDRAVAAADVHAAFLAALSSVYARVVPTTEWLDGCV